jgi:hypothetical protein
VISIPVIRNNCTHLTFLSDQKNTQPTIIMILSNFRFLFVALLVAPLANGQMVTITPNLDVDTSAAYDGYRVYASGGAGLWDIAILAFYTDADCATSDDKITVAPATMISSGQPDSHPKENALSNTNPNSWWGGRKDSESASFWLGYMVPGQSEVIKCIQYKPGNDVWDRDDFIFQGHVEDGDWVDLYDVTGALSYPATSTITLRLSETWPAPSASPSSEPSTEPSSKPPVNTDCLETETNVRLSVLTDNHPGETQWKISDWLGNAEVEAQFIQGSRYDMCIPKGCYVFTITDSSGDGICCGYGAGSYSLEVDGVSLISNGGEFLTSAYSLFGTCLSGGASDSASAASVAKKDKARK